MSNNIVLIAYLGVTVAGILFMLKNIAQLYKEVARAEKMLGVASQEMVEIRSQLERKTAEVAEKDKDIQRLTDEAKRGGIELQVKVNELLIQDREMEQLSVEVESLRKKQSPEAVKGAQDKDTSDQLMKLKEEALLRDRQVQSLMAELAKCQAGLREALSGSDNEQDVQQLIGECRRLTEELGASGDKMRKANEELAARSAELEASLRDLAAKEVEVREIRSAYEKGTGDLAARTDELARKEAEIKEVRSALEKSAGELERFRVEYPGYDERVKKLRDAENDISRLERTLEEETQSLRGVRQRAQESRMKLDLLGEKSKEAVEAIARFAEGKEFEEFRKAVHMDEIVRQYEDEIKRLKVQVIEQEKKV